jgi:hypothetical protein
MTISMVVADTLDNFRRANRKLANVAACEASSAAETAERDRSKAATVVNAMAMLRMTPATRVI